MSPRCAPAVALAAFAALVLTGTLAADDPTAPARAAALAAVDSSSPAALAAARAQLDAAWDGHYARLRQRPGPDFGQLLQEAERLGLDRAELDLLAGDAAAHRATLERLIRATSGSPLALTFERALGDLAWSGRPLPTLSLAPIPATTATTSPAGAPSATTSPAGAPSATSTPAAILFWTSWSAPSRALHGALLDLATRRPELPLLAVSLDETEHLPELFALVRPSTVVETYAPGAWDSPVARALGLRARGVPFYMVIAPDGTVRRATITPTFLDAWIRRSGR